MELLRLKKTDYDEWLALENDVFSRHNGSPMNFERSLPKMCVRDDEHMGKHFGIREDGRLRAVVGIYPLPVVIAGEKLLFSTVGNVATSPDYEGRGFMRRLMTAAMDELTLIGADASRLGGLRQRYNNYGYDKCGSLYQFTLSGRNVDKCLPDFESDLTFEKIPPDGFATLIEANRIQRMSGMAAIRSEENGCYDVYSSMTAWKNVPFAARRADGRIVGYLSVSEDMGRIAESFAENDDVLFEMIVKWQRESEKQLSFGLAPWQAGAVRKFSAICENMSVSTPSSFKIINHERVASALMKLKAGYSELPDGEFVLGIKDYGNLRFHSSGGEYGCELCEKSPDLTLDRLSAARFLYGPLPPSMTADVRNAFLESLLPLPLSWNPQDRV